MSRRRDFLQTTARLTAGATVLLLLTPLGCDDDDDDNEASSSTSPTNPAPCDGAAAVSTIVLGHAHYVCVPLADLTSPPAPGATYVTTFVNGHTHDLVLTQGMLQDINRGATVVMTTTTIQNHQHVFSLSRIVQPVSSP